MQTYPEGGKYKAFHQCENECEKRVQNETFGEVRASDRSTIHMCSLAFVIQYELENSISHVQLY